MGDRQYWFPKPYADAVARLRVPAGFLLLVTFAWFASPSPLSFAVGVPFSLAGLALRAWAAGHLAKNQDLAVSGPYAFLRNPLYVGTALTAAGLALAARSVPLALILATVFLLVYLPVIELEEQHLRKIFPSYSAYASRVPVLLPRWPSDRGHKRFAAPLYLKNQEYQALFGWLIGVAWLAWLAWKPGS